MKKTVYLLYAILGVSFCCFDFAHAAYDRDSYADSGISVGRNLTGLNFRLFNAVYHANHNGNLEECLSQGADVNCADYDMYCNHYAQRIPCKMPHTKKPMLFIAINHLQYEVFRHKKGDYIVECLLKYKPQHDVRVFNERCNAWAENAIWFTLMHATYVVSVYEADKASFKTRYTASSIQEMCYRNYTENMESLKKILQLLIDAQFDPMCRDASGATPLHYAAQHRGFEDFARILLAAGVDIDACDNDQNTPLYYAIKNSDLVTVFLLLEQGASVTPELQGMIAKTFCSWKDVVELLHMLESNPKYADKMRVFCSELFNMEVCLKILGGH